MEGACARRVKSCQTRRRLQQNEGNCELKFGGSYTGSLHSDNDDGEDSERTVLMVGSTFGDEGGADER